MFRTRDAGGSASQDPSHRKETKAGVVSVSAPIHHCLFVNRCIDSIRPHTLAPHNKPGPRDVSLGVRRAGVGGRCGLCQSARKGVGRGTLQVDDSDYV